MPRVSDLIISDTDRYFSRIATARAEQEGHSHMAGKYLARITFNFTNGEAVTGSGKKCSACSVFLLNSNNRHRKTTVALS